MYSASTIRDMQAKAARKAARERKLPLVFWPNETIDVGGMPFLGDYVPRGWRQIEVIETPLTRADLPGVMGNENVCVLVDSMGVEDAGGPSIGLESLRSLIEQLNRWGAAKHLTVGWAITEVGQFQVVVAAFAKPYEEAENRLMDGNR
jgi:hypothetical protein